MKKLDLNIPWMKILVEFASVVFAIFLALLVDEWKDDQDNKKLAGKALSNIVSETQRNYDSLATYQLDFEARIKGIDSLISLAKQEKSFRLEGYQFMTLSNTAWESAKLTRVLNYMDFEMVGQVSEVYNAQQLYSNIVQKVIDDMIFTANINSLKEAAILLEKHRSLFLSMNMLEKQLLENYRIFLEEQKAKTK